MSLNKKCSKVLSVKIRHYLNEIIIPYDLPNKECIFHKRDGLPIKVSVQSFLIIIIQCNHEINHVFRLPIEPLIEWKIVNGIKDGAFKHGNGLTAKYSDADNENCVIYYPIIRGSKDDYRDKEIPISIRIRPCRIKGSIENFSANNYCHENKGTVLTEDIATQLLILRLKQKQGFLNKMYYESYITVKQSAQEDLKYSSSQLITNNRNDENSNCRYSFDENRKILSVESKYIPECAECNVSITFQLPASYSVMNQTKITMDTNRFLSSEYIKISNSMSEYVYTVDRSDIDFDIKNNNKSIDKLSISNCPVIKIKETFWTSTAGSFPCGGGNSNSIIYYSLNEKELSKSPITFKLYERNLYEQKEEDIPHPIDEKKFWIVRKAIMGG
ncbi:hypothetical protein [Candidatus Nitrosocosmicus sp. T]